MPEFYIAALLMVLAVAGLWGYAIANTAKNRSIVRDTSGQRDRDNLALFDTRQRELEASLDSGQIDAETHALLLSEATSQLLADTDKTSRSSTEATPQSLFSRFALAVVLVGVVPLVAMTLYQPWGISLGTNDQWGVRQQLAALNNDVADSDVNSDVNNNDESPTHSFDDIVSTLESYAANHYADEELLVLLLNAYRTMNDLPNSEILLKRLLAANSDSPQLQTELAEVIYLRALSSRGQTATALANGDPVSVDDYQQIDSLLKQALTTNPESAKALSIAGMSAFRQTDYDAALGYWQRALQVLPPTSQQAQTIRKGIQTAATLSGKNIAEASIQAWVDVSVSVDLPNTLDQLDASTPVFVFARAVSGPPMPLAARRLTLGDLPVEIRLSDLDQMAALGLDSATSVTVQARLSMSGQPIAAAGDFQSGSKVVRVHKLADGDDPSLQSNVITLLINQQVD